ncbi:MAG: ATP-binding protein [Myxococcota bacterium]
MTRANVRDLLSGVRLFAHLDPPRLSEIAARGRTEAYPADHVLFVEGDEGQSIYMVLEGQVEIFIVDGQGEDLRLNTQDVGGYFGELAMLGAGVRTASVRTLVPTTLFVLDRAHFLRFLTESEGALSETLAGLVDLINRGSARAVEAKARQRQVAAQMELERHRSITQMVSGVAHELNTPLGIVKSAASLIRGMLDMTLVEAVSRDEPGARGKMDTLVSAAQMIENNIDRAHRLIESFKRLSVRQITQEPERIEDITRVFEEIVTLLDLRYRKHGLRLRLSASMPPEDRVWHGTPGILTQVLENLVGNAVRHAYPSGGGDVHLKVHAQPGQYVVQVQDDGVGIPPQVQGQIFEPFFTTTPQSTSGGSGLGLALVHNMVTGPLGGTVDVESTVGEGTVFTFTVARPPV